MRMVSDKVCTIIVGFCCAGIYQYSGNKKCWKFQHFMYDPPAIEETEYSAAKHYLLFIILVENTLTYKKDSYRSIIHVHFVHSSTFQYKYTLNWVSI